MKMMQGNPSGSDTAKAIYDFHSDHTSCTGCKWERFQKDFETDRRTGYKWVYNCIGTACANWPNGTPINISCGCPYWKAAEPFESAKQMTIFDFMNPAAGSENDLEDLPEPVMISMISAQTGLMFEYNDHLNTYQAMYNRQRIWVHYSVFNDSVPGCGGRRFISVSYLTNVGGASGPCESVKKAVERVKQYEQSILQQLQISNKL